MNQTQLVGVAGWSRASTLRLMGVLAVGLGKYWVLSSVSQSVK